MSGAPDFRAMWETSLVDTSVHTPAYVFAPEEIARQLRLLSQALGTPIVHVVAACGNSDVLSRLPEDVRFGSRCASRHEMNMVAGWKSEHQYLGMPALDASSMRAALGGRFKFIIDAPAQLEALVQVRGARQLSPVVLSVSTALLDASAPRCFQGMDADSLARALEVAQRESIPICGLHIYAGRNSFATRGLQVVQAMQSLLPALEEKLGYPLREINLGGGLEEDWWLHGHDFATYRRCLAGFPPRLTLMHEVGRAAHASGGTFVTRVVATKRIAGRDVAFCDGGLVQAQALLVSCGRAQQAPLLQRDGMVSALTPVTEAGTTVCGATGTEADVLACVAQALLPGDLLAFTGAGAYMQNLSPTLYLGHALASTYVRS